MSVIDYSNVVPVILSGGSGSRLWPKSRKAYPKQLHKLYGDYTMIQHTAMRVKHLQPPIVVCNEDQRFMVAEQLSEVCEQKPDILLEPVGRNTAPAIAAAAFFAQSKYSNPMLVILSADHLIKDVDAFNKVLDNALEKAREGKLVTFGIVPTHSETGYGYIKADIEGENEGAAVEKFVEKPDFDTAKKYLEEGGYFWNSGMFVFSATTLINELNATGNQWIELANNSLQKSQADLDFIRLNKESFSQAENISIDFALMEKTAKAWVVPLNAGWTDLGSWESLWQSTEKDEDGNAYFGDTWLNNCVNTLIHGDKKLIAAIGLENIGIIDTDDALLVVNLEQSQDVKRVVDWLNNKQRTERLHHRHVFRPWGSYDVVDEGEGYRVNRIEVKPGQKISLQKHQHRAEHWVVVKGSAEIKKGDDIELLSENQSTYIQLGETHSINNSGKLPLLLIEVQTGNYFGEDDVIRVEKDVIN